MWILNGLRKREAWCGKRERYPGIRYSRYCFHNCKNVFDAKPQRNEQQADQERKEHTAEIIVDTESLDKRSGKSSVAHRRQTADYKREQLPVLQYFSCIVYCATCGKSMQVRYEKVGRTDKDRRTGEEWEPIDKAYYICQTYNRLDKNACTSHKIEARKNIQRVMYRCSWEKSNGMLPLRNLSEKLDQFSTRLRHPTFHPFN